MTAAKMNCLLSANYLNVSLKLACILNYYDTIIFKHKLKCGDICFDTEILLNRINSL